MRTRSLCESPGELSANAGNGGSDDYSFPDARSFMMGSTQIGYNPYDTGLAPIGRNEVDSDIEISKQTNLWQKGAKIAASMLMFFPGTTGLIANTGMFLIPDVKPPGNTPLKTGAAGVVIPPPEAINPIRAPSEAAVEEDVGFWKGYFNAYKEAGATSTAAGGVDFIMNKVKKEGDESLLDVFKMPKGEGEGERSGVEAGVDAVANVIGNYVPGGGWNWMLIGGAALVLILLLK